MLYDNHKLICGTREELYKFFPKNAAVAELGVHAGLNAYNILKATNPQHLYLVDKWDWEADEKDLWWYHKPGYIIYQEALDRFKEHNNVELVRKYSYDFLKDINDRSLDWVYLDSDHGYSTTMRELELLRIKVKQGGLIAGHDYCDNKWGSELKAAVNRFCTINNWRIVALTTEEVPSFVIREALYPVVWL